MKNITLSAEEELIELAREEARRRHTTLNALFRDWIGELARRDERREQVSRLMEEAKKYQAGGPFTREEMNER